MKTKTNVRAGDTDPSAGNYEFQFGEIWDP